MTAQKLSAEAATTITFGVLATLLAVIGLVLKLRFCLSPSTRTAASETGSISPIATHRSSSLPRLNMIPNRPRFTDLEGQPSINSN